VFLRPEELVIGNWAGVQSKTCLSATMSHRLSERIGQYLQSKSVASEAIKWYSIDYRAHIRKQTHTTTVEAKHQYNEGRQLLPGRYGNVSGGQLPSPTRRAGHPIVQLTST